MSYILFLQCKSGVVRVRSGRTFNIEDGIYAYVGSCSGLCVERPLRHLIGPKRRYWHVDYLQEICRPYAVVLFGTGESELALTLSTRYPGVPGFGCSDRKGDKTHLFKVASLDVNPIKALIEVIRAIRLGAFETTRQCS